MDENRKPRMWATWLLIVLAALVTYPVVAPTVTRLADCGYLPSSARAFSSPVYGAVLMLPRDVQWFYWKYKNWWAPIPLPVIYERSGWTQDVF